MLKIFRRRHAAPAPAPYQPPPGFMRIVTKNGPLSGSLLPIKLVDGAVEWAARFERLPFAFSLAPGEVTYAICDPAGNEVTAGVWQIAEPVSVCQGDAVTLTVVSRLVANLVPGETVETEHLDNGEYLRSVSQSIQQGPAVPAAWQEPHIEAALRDNPPYLDTFTVPGDLVCGNGHVGHVFGVMLRDDAGKHQHTTFHCARWPLCDWQGGPGRLGS